MNLATTSATSALVWRLAPIVRDALEARSRRRRVQMLVAGGVGLAACAFAAWQMPRLFLRRAKHDVELRRGPFEIRSYPAVRIAETTVDASWNEALGLGLRRLAHFVFGENSAHKTIGIRSPVLGTGGRDGFHLAFVMPEGVNVAPEDSRIDVHLVPARRVASLRFSGRPDTRTIERYKRQLARILAENHLKPRGKATFAAYDPPWTIPILRRNELWVELENENVGHRQTVSAEL